MGEEVNLVATPRQRGAWVQRPWSGSMPRITGLNAEEAGRFLRVACYCHRWTRKQFKLSRAAILSLGCGKTAFPNPKSKCSRGSDGDGWEIARHQHKQYGEMDLVSCTEQHCPAYTVEVVTEMASNSSCWSRRFSRPTFSKVKGSWQREGIKRICKN